MRAGYFDAVNHYLAPSWTAVSRPARSWMRRSSTPPSSTKNSKKEREPGDASDNRTRQSVVFSAAKAHNRRGFESGYRCIPCAPRPASVSDVHMLPDLLHGDEKKVWGDAGYQGQTEAIREAAPNAQEHDLPPV